MKANEKKLKESFDKVKKDIRANKINNFLIGLGVIILSIAVILN